MARNRPYGTWDSPISASRVAEGSVLEDVAWDGRTGALVWLERRGGRGVLLAADGHDAPRELAAGCNVRARVGYGGGDFTAGHGAVVFAASGRLHALSLAGGPARALTPAFGEAAAPRLSPDGRWVAFVHSYERADRLAVVDAAGRRWPQILVDGEDFYMQPRWAPDGRSLAYVCWNHPRMPWDGTWLRLARLDAAADGMPRAAGVETVAGGRDVAVFQPEFSPDGRFLAYVADPDGWWDIFLLDLRSGHVRPLTRGPGAEWGVPAWRQEMRTFTWSADGRFLYAVRRERGFSTLWRIEAETGRMEPVRGLEDYETLAQPAAAPLDPADPARGDRVALLASGSRVPPRLIVAEIGRDGEPRARVRVAARCQAEDLGPEWYAPAQAVEWEGQDGTTVHGIYYAPTNPDFRAEGPPPAVIRIHGGPTSQALPAFRGEIQFLTSRGYAVLDVNYRGSTGYGRAYREAGKGTWGVVDVEDAVSAGRFLAATGRGDARRLAIMGGSAGGYTVLRALIQHPGFFRAAVDLYGVTDLFALAAETHKFEERYLDTLVGPLPEAAESYRERSPIFHVDRIRDPIAVFQGDEDQVVPRSQSDMLVESLRRRGVPHEYHVYAGEGHGWRKPETIRDYLAAVERFLRRHLLFA